jgi:hypothetical protein
VQGVEDEHDRAVRGRVAQELGGRLEEAEARAFRVDRRRRQVGEALAQVGHDLGELRRAGPELRAQRRAIAIADIGTQRLRPGPICGRTARLPATADQHPRAAGASARGQLLRQPALADARLALEQAQAPA